LASLFLACWVIANCLPKCGHYLGRRRLTHVVPIPARLWACGLLTLCSAPAFPVDCLIEPAQTIELATPVTGLLDKVLVQRADRVTKGQVVATLEARAEQAAAELARFKAEQTGPSAMAQNKIEFAKRKFSRRQVMTNEKLMSVQDRDDAEAELRLAESELKVAAENRQIAKLEYQQHSSLLNLRTVRSPFDGVVVEQMAYPGEVVEPGSNKKAILKLAQLDPLRVHVVLPKEAFGKVAPGTTVEVQPEVPANGRYKAKVKSVDRLIDAASGVFVVLLDMPNPRLEIPAGVRCKAHFPGSPVVSGR
jgi:RND family efflux transporter MFP subunit